LNIRFFVVEAMKTFLVDSVVVVVVVVKLVSGNERLKLKKILK
jgi:hypothetical protein